ncbi:MAG: hypothetical protein JWM98_168, partial [Thermoleophilia bacterium]|nr:hypothetical protein [Thermoleophilia bacterium]
AWARPIADLVSGEWLRGTPWPAFVLAAAGAVLAYEVGAHAWNDSLYHIGQAQKLLALDHPTFNNTVQFRDGSAHPGYLLPVWHEAIALVSWVGRVDPVTAAWILPALTFPVGILAVGGLGWAVTRAREATTVFAAAALLTSVAQLPNADLVVNGMHPGNVALGVLAPLGLAMLITALWPDPEVASGTATPRTVTRAAAFVCVVAVAGIGALHVGYLWVFGLGVLGYYVGWALRAPWPRAVVVRHLTTGLAVALVAGACLAILLPGLSSQEGLGRDAQQELAANEDSGLYEGENAANLDDLLRGGTQHFHLRADYLVLGGGMALIGLLAIALVPLVPRWPGGWYLWGSTVIVLAIALLDAVFPGFVKVVTLDQARRVERVLPLIAGLSVAALAVGVGAVRLWLRGGAQRASAALLAVGAAAGLAVVVDSVPPLAGYGGHRIVAPWIVYAVLVALGVAVLVNLALLVRRALRRNHSTTSTNMPLSGNSVLIRGGAEGVGWPTALVGRAVAGVATLVLLVGASPVYARLGDIDEPGRVAGVGASMRTAEMRLFTPAVAKALRGLPVGSTVLADPRANTRDAYIAMAIAPVYVVSSVPRHTALTPKNRVEERFRTAVSFFDGRSGPDGVFTEGLSRRERLQLLLDQHVDAIIVSPRGQAYVRRMLHSAPGIRSVALPGPKDNQRIYLVDRPALRKALAQG